MLSINQQNPSLNSFSQTKKVLSHTSNQTVLQIDYPNRVSTKVVNKKKKKKSKNKKNLAFHLPFNFLKKKKRGGKKNKKGQKEKRKPSTRPEEPGESGSSPKRKHSTREYFVN